MDNRGDDGELTTADVYKMAGRLLRRHGRDAVIIANMRAGELLDMGDLDGYRTWKRLVMLVDGMSDREMSAETRLH